jgi:hypothetical protein
MLRRGDVHLIAEGAGLVRGGEVHIQLIVGVVGLVLRGKRGRWGGERVGEDFS